MTTQTCLPERVRIASVQFETRHIASLEEFEDRIDDFTRVASEQGAQFAVIPELYTLQTLSLAPKLPDVCEAIDALTAATQRFGALPTDLSVRHRIDVIGGTHVTRAGSGAIRAWLMQCFAMAPCTARKGRRRAFGAHLP
jgi:predicted amidohydrolase